MVDARPYEVVLVRIILATLNHWGRVFTAVLHRVHPGRLTDSKLPWGRYYFARRGMDFMGTE